jgi:hypothetical protein
MSGARGVCATASHTSAAVLRLRNRQRQAIARAGNGRPSGTIRSCFEPFVSPVSSLLSA